MRIGFGYDVHRLTEGRKLILGGEQIPYPQGLAGHSDADVLLHALADAILGAISEGDLGRHFPETDPDYQSISSMIILDQVNNLAKQKGFTPSNIDATIVAESPKLEKFIPAMVENVARILGTEKDQINIKATTTEGLGFSGRGEGMAAYAVVMLRKLEA
ncbi:MAG: 2-C-methyl-D-erythritol 2,4-cyclodiphosphate synthase [Deltaproteobacteria bacterium]|nr:MAG: 2-C-methyl-D-erythritol 2,4-cyclodiphosphate synthase [Deltaproteobacteria bacterium]